MNNTVFFSTEGQRYFFKVHQRYGVSYISKIKCNAAKFEVALKKKAAEF